VELSLLHSLQLFFSINLEGACSSKKANNKESMTGQCLK